MPAHLRVYRETDDYSPEEFDGPNPAIHVRLGDLLPLVAMAQKQNFMWLKDFLDDEVRITEDLHEVLQTFRASRPSA